MPKNQRRRVWTRKPKVKERVERLRTEYIELFSGHYLPGSTLHNKTLYLMVHRYIMPSMGRQQCSEIAEYFAVDQDDWHSIFDLLIVEISKKYKSNKSLSLSGYISYMLPYYLKGIIDRQRRQLTNKIETAGLLVKEQYYIEVSESPIDSIDATIEFMKKILGYTYKDISRRFLVHPASIRRRMVNYHDRPDDYTE